MLTPSLTQELTDPCSYEQSLSAVIRFCVGLFLIVSFSISLSLILSGSGAMIAVIVLGIIIILAILLVTLKTYNRSGSILYRQASLSMCWRSGLGMIRHHFLQTSLSKEEV